MHGYLTRLSMKTALVLTLAQCSRLSFCRCEAGVLVKSSTRLPTFIVPQRTVSVSVRMAGTQAFHGLSYSGLELYACMMYEMVLWTLIKTLAKIWGRAKISTESGSPVAEPTSKGKSDLGQSEAPADFWRPLWNATHTIRVAGTNRPVLSFPSSRDVPEIIQRGFILI